MPYLLFAPVAQWIRASDFGSEGRGFESLRARHPLLYLGGNPCHLSWHGGRAVSAHATHEGRSHRRPTHVPGAPWQSGPARRLPALPVEPRASATAVPVCDRAGRARPRLQPPRRGPSADRAPSRLGRGVPDLRAPVWPPRGCPDRPWLRLRARRDRPPLPAGRRGHEPARREPATARLGLPLSRSGHESPGEPRGRLPRCLRAGRRRGPPSDGLATGRRARLADPLHPQLSGRPGRGQ